MRMCIRFIYGVSIDPTNRMRTCVIPTEVSCGAESVSDDVSDSKDAYKMDVLRIGNHA